MTDNYGEHQCTECGTPLSHPGLCARCKALNSCSPPERLKDSGNDIMWEDDNEDS